MRPAEPAVTATASGRVAETAAADFLQRRGCAILARNWRTRRCEIDIVAYRGKTVYFCEVKYRSSGSQGSGLDYITPAKQQRMHLGARSWLQTTGWHGDWQLCAIEVSGPAYRITAAVTL